MPSEKPDSFQCGPFEVAKNPDVRQFVDKLNRLREAVDSCRLQPGKGYRINRSVNGTTLDISSSGAGATAPEQYPWRVSARKNNGKTEFFVHSEGSVLDASQQLTVQGLDQWRPLAGQFGVVYLLITFDSQLAITSAAVVSSQISPSGANSSSIGLAFVTSSAQVIQSVRWMLKPMAACRNGFPALVIL